MKQYLSTHNVLKILESALQAFKQNVHLANLNYKQYMLKGLSLIEDQIQEQWKRIREYESNFKASRLEKNLFCSATAEGGMMNLIERLTKKVLHGYQNIISLCISSNENDLPGEDVVPDQLFRKISTDISKFEKCLCIEEIIRLMSEIIKKIKLAQNSTDGLVTINSSLRLLINLTPFLNQWFQLVKIYLAAGLGMHRTSCKLLSVLLTIFHTLATKGFCIPPDLQEEADKSGSTKFEDIENGGLGDGVGTKDVSENIETEDQLEDAFKEGQENEKKEEEESDVKEEEKGIEMSEDFEGKAQDPEKRDDPQKSDEEVENEDLDKKMGDVDGEDSEKLDEKVWGGDSEEDDEELEEENDTCGVTQNKQSELVAKDGKQKEDDYKNKKDQKPNDEQMEDMQNTDEYQGEAPDPMIDAPPDTEPEVVEIPDELEIKDDDVKDGGEPSDEVEELEDEENRNSYDEETDNEMDVSEGTAADNESESGSKFGDKFADTTDPFQEDEEEENMNENTNDIRLPSHTQTTEDQALASNDRNKSSADAMDTSEMDWESGSKQTDEQHQEGQAESQVTTSQAQAHEGKRSSSVKQSGEDRFPKRKPKTSDDRTVDENALEDNIKHRPIADKQSQRKTLGHEDEASDVYEHVSNKEEGVAQSVDLATKNQAAIKVVSTEYEEDSESEQEVIDISSSDDEKPESPRKQGTSFKRNQEQQSGKLGNAEDEDTQMDTEGDIIQTHTVQRGCESNIYTQHELWFSLSQKHIEEQRSKLESDYNLLISKDGGMDTDNQEINKEWEDYETSVSNLAEELCEQLRLVLEPTKMAKMKGDYRTGKRLNMRKIIPYIASQFRKDKIWLRRTKPSKRQYQIMLAVDDSSSMSDNHSKQLTFETLMVLGKSLSLLEAGELGVCSFGEKVDLLLGFNETFDPSNCAKIFQKFSFSQKKTDIAKLLKHVTETMVEARNTDHDIAKETSQLLVILSDGRGIFSLGETEVRQAVRNAKNNNVFMVFVIIDSPLNKDSILDLKSTEFGEKGVTFKPYIESFPFPFYIILREISALPVVLGEALRQWFELVTSFER